MTITVILRLRFDEGYDFGSSHQLILIAILEMVPIFLCEAVMKEQLLNPRTKV